MKSTGGNATSSVARSKRRRLGLFRVPRKVVFCFSKRGIIAGINILFDGHDKETLDNVRRGLLRRHHQFFFFLGMERIRGTIEHPA